MATQESEGGTQAPDDAAVIVGRWWRRLHPDEHGRGDRGPRARLRRCASPAQALLEPETLRLIDGLRSVKAERDKALCERIDRALAVARAGCGEQAVGAQDDVLAGIACLAACLAMVEPPAGKPGPAPNFATCLGQTSDGWAPQEGEQPRHSRLRFARLLQAENWSDRQRELRRALKVLGDARFDVRRFGQDLLWWDDNARRRWVLAYHQQFKSHTKEASQ